MHTHTHTYTRVNIAHNTKTLLFIFILDFFDIHRNTQKEVYDIYFFFPPNFIYLCTSRILLQAIRNHTYNTLNKHKKEKKKTHKTIPSTK